MAADTAGSPLVESPLAGGASLQQAPPLASRAPVLERAYAIETPLYHAVFSNRGARLVSMELKRYASAHGASNYERFPGKRPRLGTDVPSGDRVVLESSPAFGVDLGSGSLLRTLAGVVYDVAESTDAMGEVRALTFTARDSGGLVVRQTYRARDTGYGLDLEVEIRGVPDGWRISDYSLTARSWPLLTESNLEQDLRSLRGVSLVGTNLHRDAATGLVGKQPKTHDGAATFAGVQSHYFMGMVASTGAAGRTAIAAAEASRWTPEQASRLPPGTKPAPTAAGTLVMPLPTPSSPVQRFIVYFGPGEYDLLRSVGHGLERAVDLGWNWVVPVSKLLLWLLKLIEGWVHNYGVTIILLATLVRLVLHPVNMSSMKSMRAMQKLQPEIERIREKYKNDPQAMNAATMALYRENKVNPAGGCLPMLMQMPLFIALYAVLYNAIDLRQAPFVAWMHDLSSPDALFSIGPFPVRLLPLLMAGTGFLSQVLAPMDPKQAPTMYLMNFVMLFFFYNLPSGLVLYWTVMNVLTALQQWMVNRSDDGVVVIPAAAGKGGKPGKPGRRG
jgi:YidC/Oxa1 family membrane protein insertase